MDEVTRPRLPGRRRAVGVDALPVIAVDVGVDVLLGDVDPVDPVTYVSDRLDHADVSGATNAFGAVVPFGDRSDRRRVIDRHAVRRRGRRPRATIAEDVSGRGDPVDRLLNVRGVI